MNEEPPKDLATRAFQKRVLDEFAAVRREQATMGKGISELRGDVVEIRTGSVEIRTDIAEIRAQQTAAARNIASLDQRATALVEWVTSIEGRVAAIEEHVTSVDQLAVSIDERLTTLEDKVDVRLKETRPIWENVQAQLQRVVEKFDVVLRDIYDVRIDVTVHGRRIGELERRAS